MLPRLIIAMIVSMSTFAATAAASADESPAELEAKLLGNWRGGPCMGVLQFSKDGTFERRHYSPGGNEITGTWKLKWNALPPKLTLTVKTSDDPKAFPLGKVWELKLVGLDAKSLSYQIEGDDRSTSYRRQTLDEKAVELMQGYVIHAKLTQSIGMFSSFGMPKVGDTFTLDLANLPKDMLKLKSGDEKSRPSYIPFSAQPKVVSVKQGPRDNQPRRSVIDLATPDPAREVRIRIMTESVAVGSPVRLQIYRPGDFLGSMAEAEGTLK
jgi:hypothetical protein